MQQEVNWRHLVGAVVLVGLLIFAGWSIVNRPQSSPRSQAPAGPNARTQDAPEAHPAGAALPAVR